MQYNFLLNNFLFNTSSKIVEILNQIGCISPIPMNIK